MLLHCLFLSRRQIVCETVGVCWTVPIAEVGGAREVHSEVHYGDERAQCHGH